jgi:hypothetical protein
VVRKTIISDQYPALPEEIEAFRDEHWRRTPELAIENAFQAEALIERVGFCSALTDARRAGPSIYIAVTGRRDAHMPRNVQKDPEASLAWTIKDEVMRRGRVYYAKLARGRAMFLAQRLVPHFNSLWGIPNRRAERDELSAEAQAVLKILRREWEMASADLRRAAKIENRAMLTRALDELQRRMLVIPGDVLYSPVFTYVWTLTEARFREKLNLKVERDEALREIARAFLDCAGLALRGELARASGLSRPEAGLGNRALVAERYAVRPKGTITGTYMLKGLDERLGFRI